VDELTQQIANQLQEPNIELISRVVQHIGPDAALAFLQQTLTIEAQGGMLTSNKKRRRTPGGVFFYLVKGGVSKKEWRAISPPSPGKERKKRPPVPAFTWEERLGILPHVLEKRGAAMSAKMTLIGRPARATRRGDVVVTAMTSDKVPSLPKGLPTPPTGTTYVVYIAFKQWAKVAEALRNPEDALIVEGYPAFDERIPGMAIFATNVTTKLRQQARRAQQAQKAE